MKVDIIHNMPAEEYHSLERLSYSGIKNLMISSQDFWNSSWMNPDRKDKKTDSLNLGSAYHTMILEGYDVFNKRYAVPPVCDKRTKEGKEVFREWSESHPNTTPISTEDYDNILKTYKRVLDVTDAFVDGEAEVTLLWTDDETNVPMKARVDYLKKGNKIKDLKTFSNSGNDINRVIANSVIKYKYYLQEAVYTTALPDHEFEFVFVQSGDNSNVVIKNFPKTLLLHDKGLQMMRYGINKFASNVIKFGDKPWYDEVEIGEFTDSSFPLYSYDD